MVNPRIIAVDWSGRSGPNQSRTIWLAEAIEGRLVRLECGRTRNELVDHLTAEAERDPHFIAGFDFAFSVPEWFLEQQGIGSARELWSRLAEEELTPSMRDKGLAEWMKSPDPPFWRTAEGHALLAPDQKFRRTEYESRSAGAQPKSVFQLVGAGQVGPGSLYGMQALHKLAAEGFSIWPFDPPGFPRVVEIFPRLLTGAVTKSSQTERERYLSTVALPDELRLLAVTSEDACDAAISALAMAMASDELMALSLEPDYALEGRIWQSKTPRVPRREDPLREPRSGRVFDYIGPATFSAQGITLANGKSLENAIGETIRSHRDGSAAWTGTLRIAIDLVAKESGAELEGLSPPTLRPRRNADPFVVRRKLERLREAHIAPLTVYVERLREAIGGEDLVPWFDPDDAGTEALMLLLLESPGPRAVASRGSGFISADNDDPTAEAMFHLRKEAGISRRTVAAWNVVPWYLEGDKARPRDLDRAVPSLLDLLSELPNLCVVVLMGNVAQDGWRRLARRRPISLPTISVPHPARRSMIRPGTRERILDGLRSAQKIVDGQRLGESLPG